MQIIVTFVNFQDQNHQQQWKTAIFLPPKIKNNFHRLLFRKNSKKKLAGRSNAFDWLVCACTKLVGDLSAEISRKTRIDTGYFVWSVKLTIGVFPRCFEKKAVYEVFTAYLACVNRSKSFTYYTSFEPQ